MLRLLHALYRAAREFQDYRPTPVTRSSLTAFLNQFDKADNRLLLDLIRYVKYVGEAEARASLVDQNRDLLSKLAKAGIPAKKVIYVQIHDAGSSSPVTLNELRDADALIQRGCTLVDAHEIDRISKLTEKLAEGAIVYVDDFIGSGNQMARERNKLAEFIIGTFSEFALAVCICEEGAHKLSSLGVEPRAKYIHVRSERPLHDACSLISARDKSRLRELCSEIDPRAPLGYLDMATMVILHRNAPNTTPRILRGSQGQDPFRGFFPRSDDLPIKLS